MDALRLNVLLSHKNIHERWDHFFISNIMQEFVKHPDIFCYFSCDHLPIIVSLTKSVIKKRGRRLWKSNYSLLHEAKFIEEMKNHTTASLKNFDEENIRN